MLAKLDRSNAKADGRHQRETARLPATGNATVGRPLGKRVSASGNGA